MCGVWGRVSNRAPLAPEVIGQIQAGLRHRGPDGEGVYQSGGVTLGHRRLAIIDLNERSAQPMVSEDGRYVLTFNGEIYNYRDLRGELGRTHEECPSDTHVLLAAWQQWGVSCLNRLNGMFAFGLWDRSSRELVLARDRLGIKPLFYQVTDSGIAFGSELGSVLLAGRNDARADLQTLGEYLCFGNAIGRRTFYASIRTLAPGTVLSFRDMTSTHKRFGEVTTRCEITDKSYPEAVGHLRSLLSDAVGRHLISDRPVAIFLSGGIDSSTVACLAARRDPDIVTVTAQFGRVPSPDVEQAVATAREIGVRHQTLKIVQIDSVTAVRRLARQHGQPFGDAATVPLLAMAASIGAEYPVVLQGDGGDEVFGGYRRYRHLRLMDTMGGNVAARQVGRVPERLSRLLPSRIRRYAEAFGAPNPAERTARLLTQVSNYRSVWSLIHPDIRRHLELVDPYREYERTYERLKSVDSARACLRADLAILLPNTFLEKVDRATMAAGVEARVPLLDTQVVNFVVSLPTSWLVDFRKGKRILRDAMRGIVPEPVLRGRKAGFGTPVAEWMRAGLGDQLQELLCLESVSSVVDRGAVETQLSLLREGRASFGTDTLLYRLLQLGLWLSDAKVNDWVEP